jgi:hypothetical protein
MSVPNLSELGVIRRALQWWFHSGDVSFSKLREEEGRWVFRASIKTFSNQQDAEWWRSLCEDTIRDECQDDGICLKVDRVNEKSVTMTIIWRKVEARLF